MIIPDDVPGLPDDDSGGAWSYDSNRLLKAVDDESLEVLETLISKGAPVNAHGGVFHETPLHKAAKQAWTEGLKLLLANGATPTSMNQYGQTALHYASASKSVECIRNLLDSNACQAILDHKDMRGHAPLHDAASVGHPKVVALLLKAGANVNVRDKKEETPLHKAARARSTAAMMALLNQGADLGARDQAGESVLGFILRHLPGGMENLLDHCLIPNATKLTSKKLEVAFNFIPLAGPSELNQMKILNDAVDFGHPKLLLHPVCEAFLLLKWHNVRKLFFIDVIFYFVHAILSTFIILEKFAWREMNGTPFLKVQADVSKSLLIILLLMASVILLKQVLTIIQGVRSWIFSPWHVLNIAIPVLVLTVMLGHKAMYWQHHFATVTLLLLWVHCMLHIGRFPDCGIYVAMFTRVAKVFVRMFLIFFCLLLAFSLSFYVSEYSDQHWRNNTDSNNTDSNNTDSNNTDSNNTDSNKETDRDQVYVNPLITFIKTLTMMIGELDFESKYVTRLSYLPGTAHLIYFGFVILVSIILANLLVALAVNDVQGLRNSAHLERLIKQMELVYQMEKTFYSLTTLAKLINFRWFHTKLKLFVHDFQSIKVFVQPFHPQKSSKMTLVQRGLLKDISLRKNYVSIIMECLRLRGDESSSSMRKSSVRPGRRQVRSEYSVFSDNEDHIGDLMKSVEQNILYSFSEKFEEVTESLNLLSKRLKILEDCLQGKESSGGSSNLSRHDIRRTSDHWNQISNNVVLRHNRGSHHEPTATSSALQRQSQPILRRNDQPQHLKTKAVVSLSPHLIREDKADVSQIPLLLQDRPASSSEKHVTIQLEMVPQNSNSVPSSSATDEPSNKDSEHADKPTE